MEDGGMGRERGGKRRWEYISKGETPPLHLRVDWDSAAHRPPFPTLQSPGMGNSLI